MAGQKEDITALNRIATILIDARRLHHRAAHLSNSAEARDRIERTMEERSQLLADTQQMVRELGGQPAREGSFRVAAHKAFLDVRDMFDRDEQSALAEVERGETYLRDDIRKAMRDTRLNAETRAYLGIALDRLVSGEMPVEDTTSMPSWQARNGAQAAPRHH